MRLFELLQQNGSTNGPKLITSCTEYATKQIHQGISNWEIGCVTEGHPVFRSSFALPTSYMDSAFLIQQGFEITDPDRMWQEAYEQFQPDMNFLVFAFQDWMRSEALFQVFANQNEGRPWDQWPKEQICGSIDLKAYQKELLFQTFVQQELYLLYKEAKQAVNDLGVRIIGTLPFLPVWNSSDVYGYQDTFIKKLDTCEYNWDASIQNKWKYMLDRIAYCSRLYDGVILEGFEQVMEHKDQYLLESLSELSEEIPLYIDVETAPNGFEACGIRPYTVSK